tara:strand:+ start:15535 stop:16626 length:1092 start_codon:yes stop_codon:yes gene_type:complete
MGLLEFANFTVADVVKKSTPSFYSKDPLLESLRTRNKVIRSGGTNVRVPRIKSGHSDITEINGTSLEIPLSKKETFDFAFGDWARMVKPIILPHIDRDRMQSNADKKRWVNDTTAAVMQSFHNAVSRQIYVGDVAQLTGLGTLNGGKSGLSSSGFERGALEFAIPSTQNTNGNSYMNLARRQDTTNDEDNYYNQFAEHAGFASSYLDVAEELKITADSYAEDGEGISLAVCSIPAHVAIGKAIRNVGGTTGTGLMYRPEDLESGKAHKVVHVAGGIKYFSNRFMTDARMLAAGAPSGGTGDFVYLLNPNGIHYYVNANNDFRVSKFTDHTMHGNMDADVAYVFLEVQLAVHNLLIQACTADLT